MKARFRFPHFRFPHFSFSAFPLRLAPYWRLRVDRMRVIYEPRSVAGQRQLVCFFADHRATVYAVLEP